MSYFIKPILVSTKVAQDLVGGSRVWQDLLDHHGDILLATRMLSRGDAHWRYDTIEQAVAIAESAGTLISMEHKEAWLKQRDRRTKREKAA